MSEVRYLEAMQGTRRITCLDDGTDERVLQLLDECRRAAWNGEPFVIRRMLSDTRGDQRHADGKDMFRGHQELAHWEFS